ncbi:hypothetical protein [Streptomyces noursei]|uniref:hypothetical protein n=1 Tax=Streptomyces noursei TaxID=1971 RepID=UPI001678EC4D|nr:hypothetical protein [Streptomyces noursei]MCZ1014481.1 hypothetical protein [Streptomyces noursei]GGW95359.1 hypothetical protein GCM10010341_15710 [Streptomyces noursei]
MTPETLVRLAVVRAYRDLSDLARYGVGNINSSAGARERIEEARRLRVLANELVDLVVLSEALADTSWQVITQALNRRDAETVQCEYAEAITEWRAAPAEAYEGIDGDARDLDTWYRAHRDDSDPVAENPASDLLQAD